MACAHFSRHLPDVLKLRVKTFTVQGLPQCGITEVITFVHRDMFWMWSQQISKVIGLKGCPNRLGSKSRLHVELVCIVIGTPLRIFTTMAWRTFPCDPCSRHDVLPRGWRCLSANKGFLSAREFVRLCAPATRVA